MWYKKIVIKICIDANLTNIDQKNYKYLLENHHSIKSKTINNNLHVYKKYGGKMAKTINNNL